MESSQSRSPSSLGELSEGLRGAFVVNNALTVVRPWWDFPESSV